MNEIWGAIISFFNSVFFLGVVGLSAILLYFWQKKDIKRDAVRTILQEIKYAESQIRNFKTLKNYSFADKLLATNSWNNNVHLFINDLSDPEIDMISRFYANAAYLDQVISKISDDANNIKIFKQPIPYRPIPIPSQSSGEIPPQDVGQINLTIEQIESNSQNILKEVSNNVEMVGSTSAADKLRKISQHKIFFFF